MRVLDGLGELAGLIGGFASAIPSTIDMATQHASKIVKEKVDAIYGDASELAVLSDYTQVDRAAKGYSQNNPLFRDGELLKDSVRIERVEPGMVIIGSDEPVHLYHELGYMNARTGNPVPPRPVFHIAAAHSEKEVAIFLGAALDEMFVTIAGE